MNRLLLLLLLACVPLAAGADALVKPLPAVDTSRLPAAAQAEVRAALSEFEKQKPALVGDSLAVAYAQVGAVLARYGQYEPMRVAFDNAIAISPDDGRFLYLRGVFAEQAGRLDEARSFLTQALAKDQAYLPIRYHLAETQLALNDLAGARRTAADVVALRPELAPARVLLGQVALREKKYAEAVAQFRAALAADPKATIVYAGLADALAGTGDAKGAAEARKKAGNVLPAYGDPLVQGVFARPLPPLEQAIALAAKGQHANARTLLDAALKAKPNDATLLAAYARVEADAGNEQAAAQRAAAAVRAAPNDAQANLAQAIVLESAGEERAAQPYYQRAVAADGKLAEARLLYGNVLLRQKQFAPAAEQYRQLAVLKPEDGSAHARYAIAQAAAGRCGDALRDINVSLRQRPRDGGLLQTFVRLAATCATASNEERQMAVDYAQALYKQRPDQGHSEALAMALAATGKTKDAFEYEAAAMFDATRANDQAAVAWMKPLLDRFKAGQKALTPWPAGHPFVAPPPLAPSLAPTQG
ncbi:MAG TPA: tetratricopeptide repeat protein [Xanthomonadales bacterium]|nr:tetratricopeptide repeat protein [Xanthomonadales bacterium]